MAMSFHEPFAAPQAFNPRLVSNSDREDDEIWHVAVSPDDIKAMTLEQLDDALRLDIVDSATPVWKNGMSAWQPLGVAAGMETEEEEVSATHVVVIESPITRTRPAHPPPPSPPLKNSWPPSSFSLAGPATAFKPPPVVAPLPHSVSHVRATTQAPVFDTPRSFSPAAFTIPAPLVRASPPSGVGRWLLGLAFVAGLTLTLYRNDFLLQLARSARLESQFLRAERALVGGPSFGTARSLESGAWSRAIVSNIASPTSLANAEAPAEAPTAAPTATPSTKDTSTRTLAVENLALEKPNAPSGSSPKAPSQATSEVAPKKSASLPSATEKTDSTPRSSGASAPPKSASKRKAAVKAAAAGSDASETRAAPARDRKSAASPRAEAPARTTPEPRRVSTPKSRLLDAIGESLRKQKSKGPNSDYDPMNGSL